MDMIISGKYKDFDYITVNRASGTIRNWAGQASGADLSFGGDCSIAEISTFAPGSRYVEIADKTGTLQDGAARPYIQRRNDG